MRIALALAVALVACAADPVPLTACTAGVSTACTCSSGATGAQVCRTDGSGYGACMCSAGDAGADAAGDVPGLDVAVDALQPDAAGDAGVVDADPGVDVGGPCPSNLTYCDGICRDTRSDPRNCVFCGNLCPDGWACVARACVDPRADAGHD